MPTRLVARDQIARFVIVIPSLSAIRAKHARRLHPATDGSCDHGYITDRSQEPAEGCIPRSTRRDRASGHCIFLCFHAVI